MMFDHGISLNTMRRMALSGTALSLAGFACSTAVYAQTPPAELPEIVVSAPSPLTVTVRGGRRGDSLTVVDRAFSTVTFVPASELLSNGGKTLGDQLSSLPGITNSGFAPGAAVRPVIRGLDNFRVRIQENGIGSQDVSDLGEDHAIPIDPLAAQRVEVVRGPATLRFGSTAIGGVVSVDNNRIPSFLPPPGFTSETRTSFSSVDRGREASTLLDVRAGNFVVHGDFFARRTEDYRISNSSQTGGKQLNSFTQSNGQSIGGSYFLPDNGGFLGLSFTHFTSLYGIPGTASAASRTRIDLEQFKLAGKGQFNIGGSFIDTVRFWIGGSVYRHKEEGLNDDGRFETGAVFKNREIEGRVEVNLTPVQTSLGRFSTAVGIQTGRQQIGTSGEAGGLLQPTDTRTLAGFVFNELQLTERTRLQVAGRIESARTRGNGALFPPGNLPTFTITDSVDPDTGEATQTSTADDPVSVARRRRFLPVSASLGLLQDLPFGFVGSITGQYVERAPRAAELYSRGAHDAPGTFELGDVNLKKERARTIEIGLRRAAGPLRFDAAFYATQYTGFIYRRSTGIRCDDDFASCGTGTELAQVAYTQRNATFVGGELKTQYDFLELSTNVFGVEGQYDVVRARFQGSEQGSNNVPRIPPQRVGGGLYWRGGDNWTAKVTLLHAFRQKDIAAEETETKGYNLLNAELSYRTKFAAGASGPPVEITAGIAGTNLLNETIRNHVLFRKNEVVQPGRGVRGFLSVKF
jgi:iron complex outermembrane recepter protein